MTWFRGYIFIFFLFVLNAATLKIMFVFPVSRFIKYTGYGNAAGLLAARGLLRGGHDSGIYSEDEDSETEEYREAKAQSVNHHTETLTPAGQASQTVHFRQPHFTLALKDKS